MLCASMLLVGQGVFSQSRLPDIFDCRIQQYFQQDDNGVLFDLLIEPKTAFVQETKGASLLVDRSSGKVLTKAHALGFLPNYVPDVAELGNDKQSFKVRYTTPSGPYLHLAYLEIKTYALTKQKPFVLIDGESVFSGVCK